MRAKIILFLILGIDVVLLFFQFQQLSISSAEVYLLFESHNYIAFFYKILFSLFGHNDFTLRIPMLVLHSVSFFLFYELSKRYLTTSRDRIWLMFVYVMLPGMLSNAIVVSHASFILCGLLLYFYVLPRVHPLVTKALLVLFALFEGGFGYLFLGLLLYSLKNKSYKESAFYTALVVVSAYLYHYNIYGFPRGHFLDTLAVYSAILTPFIFIYLVYVLYRRYLAGKRDRLWYVASTTLLGSLILSFRQRLDIEYIAPYLIIALPLVAQTFRHSYHVRLKQFRKRYKFLFAVALAFLLLNTLVVLMNKSLFAYIDNPKKHFAYNMYVAKELAQELKKQGIKCVTTDKKMEKRLEFYGVGICQKNYLETFLPTSSRETDVTIRYNNRAVYKANVTKINIE